MVSFEGILFAGSVCLIAGWIASMFMDIQNWKKKRLHNLELGDPTHDEF
jgi:hypothetical protein